MKFKNYINMKLNRLRSKRGFSGGIIGRKPGRKDKNFYRSQFNKLLVSIVIVILIIIIKKINAPLTDKAVEIVKNTINYNVDIKKDSQIVWGYTHDLVKLPTKVVSVFNSDKAQSVAETGFIPPAHGDVFQHFGEIEKSEEVKFFYNGIDILVEKDEIFSMGQGTVIETGQNTVLGKHIKIDHGVIIALYAQLDVIYVVEGQKISKGETIGAIKADGTNLLHLKVWQEDKAIDPLTIFSIKNDRVVLKK